jgi:hypothetical protein
VHHAKQRQRASKRRASDPLHSNDFLNRTYGRRSTGIVVVPWLRGSNAGHPTWGYRPITAVAQVRIPWEHTDWRHWGVAEAFTILPRTLTTL